MTKQTKATVAAAFRSTLPVITGFLPLGSAFGLMAYNAGWGAWYPVAASIFVFAGSAQFMAIELIASGATLINYAITIFLLNSRHLFYGLSVFKQFDQTGRAKPYMIFSLTDECYAVLTAKPPPPFVKQGLYYIMVALIGHTSWIAGTLIGVFAGSIVRFNTQGLDFALTALFIVILTEQLCASRNKLPFVIGAISAVLSAMLLGSSQMLLGCALGSIILLLFLKKRIEPGKE